MAARIVGFLVVTCVFGLVAAATGVLFFHTYERNYGVENRAVHVAGIVTRKTSEYQSSGRHGQMVYDLYYDYVPDPTSNDPAYTVHYQAGAGTDQSTWNSLNVGDQVDVQYDRLHPGNSLIPIADPMPWKTKFALFAATAAVLILAVYACVANWVWGLAGRPGRAPSSGAPPDVSGPLQGAAFDEIYEREIAPQLAQLERSRRNAVGVLVLAVIAGSAAVCAEYLFIRSPTLRTFPIIFTFLVAAIFGCRPLYAIGVTAKTKLIPALCAPIGVTYAAYAGKAASDFDRLLELCLLPKPPSVALKNLFSGRRGETQFEFCDATLGSGSGRNPASAFEGQLIRLSAPGQRRSTTVVLRKYGWLDRSSAHPAGLAQVGLEDPKFSSSFVAYSSDQVEAREILTPAFIEELDGVEAAYAGNYLRCAFDDGEFLLAIEGDARFNIGSLLFGRVDKARIEQIARDIEQVFNLIDQFRLL